MKRQFLAVATALLASSLALPAQGPHSHGDRNRDGLCDTCGKPTGQGTRGGDQKKKGNQGKGRQGGPRTQAGR